MSMENAAAVAADNMPHKAHRYSDRQTSGQTDGMTVTGTDATVRQTDRETVTLTLD